MKDLMVLVATGFEDTELITTINIFNRNGISYDLVSIENKDTIQGQNEAYVKTKRLNTTNTSDYHGLFLPGGKGHLLMLNNKLVIDIVKSYQNKYLFAICAAPSILLKANVINGPFTSYPGFAKDYRNTGKPLEILPKMITARDYETTISFAKAIVTKFKKKHFI